jgi:hypothetical protein
MASTNDAKIKTLLQTIEAKRESLGVKPKASWETNGVINGRNINTLNSIEACVALASELMLQKGFYDTACAFLDVDGSSLDLVKGIDDALKDVKLRVQMIKWDNEKKKLTAAEKQLKDLRSEDLKTEDALSVLEKEFS